VLHRAGRRYMRRAMAEKDEPAAGEQTNRDASHEAPKDKTAEVAKPADTAGAPAPGKDTASEKSKDAGESGSATTAPAAGPARLDQGGEGTDAASSRAVMLGAVLLVLIVGGVLVSFAISKGGDEPARRKPAAANRDPAPPPWKEGQQVDVEITVLPEDKDN